MSIKCNNETLRMPTLKNLCTTIATDFELAEDIVENLESALDSFREIIVQLKK